MVSSIAGFVTPWFVGSFVLRPPEEVEAEGGPKSHELSVYALYVPIFSFLCILGWVYLAFASTEKGSPEDIEESAETETTRLVPDQRVSKLSIDRESSAKTIDRGSSVRTIETEFSISNEGARLRRMSMIGGQASMIILFPFDADEEQNRREKLWEEKKQWDDMMSQDL